MTLLRDSLIETARHAAGSRRTYNDRDRLGFGDANAAEWLTEIEDEEARIVRAAEAAGLDVDDLYADAAERDAEFRLSVAVLLEADGDVDAAERHRTEGRQAAARAAALRGNSNSNGTGTGTGDGDGDG